MGNCCPTGSSYAVQKPVQEQNADIARQDSCVSGGDGGAYRKKQSRSIPSSPLIFENEALDLRERTLDNDPPVNGTVTTQPVSVTNGDASSDGEEVLAEAKDKDKKRPNGNVQNAMSDGTEAIPTKAKTTTKVFIAMDVRQSSGEDMGSFDPDYDTIQPQSVTSELVTDNKTSIIESKPSTFHNQAFEDDVFKPAPTKLKTTEVVMRMQEPARPESDQPGYASIHSPSNSQVSQDSHTYSNPDDTVFSGTGYRNNAQDTGQGNNMNDEDDYAAVSYEENHAGNVLSGIGDTDIQLEMNEVEDDPDYYEIGHPNIAAVSMKVAKEKSTLVHSETEKEAQDKTSSAPDSENETTATTDDIYATIDKSRKISNRSTVPFGHSNNEEDRELNEMWMEIETIEEKLCTTLTRDSLSDDFEEDKEEFYFTFVNETIEELSRKNDALWLKEAHEVNHDHADASLWNNASEENGKASFFSVDEVIASYQKSVDILNQRTANELMDHSKRNEEDIMKIISEHRDTQLEHFKWREAEKMKFDEKLKQKLAEKHRSMTQSSSEVDICPDPPPKTAAAMETTDSDSDTERVKASYRGLVSVESDEEDGELTMQFSSESSTPSSSDEESLKGEDKLQANETLKRTLKDDVTTNLGNMTGDDFKNLMGLYRNTRKDIKQTRDAEKSKWDISLWDKLAQRRKDVDKYVYDNESTSKETGAKSTKYTKTVQTSSEGSAFTQTINVNKVESSTSTYAGNSSMGVGTHVDTHDAETDMGDKPEQMNQEIKRLDREFIKKASSNLKNVDQDKFQELVKVHLDSVSRLRGERDASRMAHREKILAQLDQRKRQGATRTKSSDSSSSVSSSDSDPEPIQRLVKTVKTKEDVYQMELEENKDKVLTNLVKEKGSLSPNQIEAVLKKYHNDQEEVHRRRQLEREATDLKLQQKLDSRKKKRLERAQAKTAGDHSEMGDKDNQFYHDLMKKRQQGEIRDADIGRLIEEHLAGQEEEVRRMKREARIKHREQRKRELEANPELAHDLVEREREQKRQRQQITKEQKAKMDKKTQGKTEQEKTEAAVYRHP